ncbi:serine hydrolase [Oscillatoria sp. CS-180]|nr:serine hydrolase [Oscillatoria sp. CS-180]
MTDFRKHCTGAVSRRLLIHESSQWSPIVLSGLDFLENAHTYDQLRYNVEEDPPFLFNSDDVNAPDLEQIVKSVVSLLEAQGYPTESVSVSLVDLTGDCCDYGEYQSLERRYPASTVKLFWLVALYGYYEADILQPDVGLPIGDEALMTHYSNNGASSRVLDLITQTQSGDNLDEANLLNWIEARNTINDYFALAGYSDINIAHKTFPIPDLNMTERTGRDLQFADRAQKEAGKAIEGRNYLTTFALARLLYEIETGQAISAEYSDRIKQHLHHSTDPAVWQYEDNNAIEGFFGEYLPPDVRLYTKLGFTFDDGRQEAAIISSPDGKTKFILVVFANDSVYSDVNSKVFPEVAEYVYNQMQLRSSKFDNK